MKKPLLILGAILLATVSFGHKAQAAICYDDYGYPYVCESDDDGDGEDTAQPLNLTPPADCGPGTNRDCPPIRPEYDPNSGQGSKQSGCHFVESKIPCPDQDSKRGSGCKSAKEVVWVCPQ